MMAMSKFEIKSRWQACFLNYLRGVTMGTAQDAPLATAFNGRDASMDSEHGSSPLDGDAEAMGQHDHLAGVQKLIPVIFCHGLTGSRTSQSGSCRDLASHGYIVFSLDHHDGSAHYSRKRDGSEKYWSQKDDLMCLDMHQENLEVRAAEVKGLIDDMHEEDFLQSRLGFSAQATLDLSKIIVGGHSFGGVTAMVVAERDSRVSACCTLDPWLWAVNDQIDANKFSLTCPQVHVVTESFEPAIASIFKYSSLEQTEKVMN